MGQSGQVATPRRVKKWLRGPIFRKNGQNFGFFGLNRDPGGAEGRLRTDFLKKWPKSGKKRKSREKGQNAKMATFPDCKLREKSPKWHFWGSPGRSREGSPGSPGPVPGSPAQVRSRGPKVAKFGQNLAPGTLPGPVSDPWRALHEHFSRRWEGGFGLATGSSSDASGIAPLGS